MAALMMGSTVWAQTPQEKGLQSINQLTAEAHVAFLADDDLEGREAGTQGGRIAGDYIVSMLKSLGIRPVGDSYYHPFEVYHAERQKKGQRWQVEPDSIAKLKQVVHQKLSLNNVLGMIEGKNKNEYVIVGAHYDHLGIDPMLDGDQIYNGADDNASGVAAVLQIMKAFVASGVQPERTVVFAFWDGEEFGLLGSQYFTDHFAEMSKVKGYLNFDMVGSGTSSKYLMYFFTAAHPKLGEWLKNDINKYHFSTFEPDYRAWENPVGGSDQQSFHLKGVPIVWFHTGGQPHYNQPSDEASTINYPKLTDITRASYLTTWHLANEAEY